MDEYVEEIGVKDKKISFVVSPGLEKELKAIPDTEYYRGHSQNF
jgi:hypothetical protein